MTGGTTSTHGRITLRTASEVHGTGVGTGARIGACLHGATAGMTHGTGDGAILGTTAVTGADGMTHGTTGDTGVGMIHGTTAVITVAIGAVIGACTTHGIRTMPDGTAASVLIGDTATARALEAEDISQARHGMARDMRHRRTTAYLPELKGLRYEEASAPAAAQAEAPSEEAALHEAAPQRSSLQEAHLLQEER